MTYATDTDFDGLKVHAMDKDNRRWEVKVCEETYGDKVFSQMGVTGGAAKETYRYLTFDGAEGQELDVWARGDGGSDRVLKLGIGDYQAEHEVALDTIYNAAVTYIHWVLPSDGTYYIYTSKGNWDLYEAVLSAAPIATQPGEGDEEMPESLVNTTSDTHVQKICVNGQVYIIRDGRTYNILGLEIK